jgi:hypothetical protein
MLNYGWRRGEKNGRKRERRERQDVTYRIKKDEEERKNGTVTVGRIPQVTQL